MQKRRYVLVYASPADPPEAEVNRTLESLGDLNAEEVLPGTIQIVGDPQTVEQTAGHIDGWTLSTEGQLSDRRPHHGSKR